MTINPGETLKLEILREGNRLRFGLAFQHDGQAMTRQDDDEMPFNVDLIGRRTRQLIEALNRANENGRLTGEALETLKRTGQIFRDDLLPAAVKRAVDESGAGQLMITVDEHLAHIPWELLHDGRRFLCQRFAVGRVLRTRRKGIARPPRKIDRPLKMLVLADPCGDLPFAYEEGIDLRDFMDGCHSQVLSDLRVKGVDVTTIQSKIRGYDWVHFAGHGDHDEACPANSGWRLHKSRLTAAHITRMEGTGSMPALIFSNACRSARSEVWNLLPETGVSGLADAFILAGVRHYVGTFWKMPDADSGRFALEFYRLLLAGKSVGHALWEARKNFIAQNGEENIVWAGYLLYGDPMTTYFDRRTAGEKPPAADAAMEIASHQTLPKAKAAFKNMDHTRHQYEPPKLETAALSRRRPEYTGWKIAAAAAVAILLAILITLCWRHHTEQRYLADKEKALAAFESGRFGQTEQICRALTDKALKEQSGGDIF